MGVNHMGEQQLHKKPETIHITREAEDVFAQNRKFSLDPFAPQDMVSNNTLKDEKANPLIKRELMLRMQSALKSDGEDTTLTKMIQDLDAGKYFDAEEMAEKQWISRSMDSYVQKQEELRIRQQKEKEREEKRKAHEERKKKRNEEAEKKRLINERKDMEVFAKEHSLRKNSDRLNKMINEARYSLGRSKEVYRLGYIPSKKLMVKDYKRTFSNKVNDRKRAEKKKNKRSRLFQKIKNEELLKQVENDTTKLALNTMAETVNAQKLVISDEKEYQDLAQFMLQGESEYNLNLLRKYFGNNENPGPGGREGQDVQVALDMMAQSMFEIPISGLNFETDADMVKNASALEMISNRIAAFDRMAKKHNYMSGLQGNVKDILEERLESLRSIAAYYNVRKELIQNSYYRDHYNEELSMDSTVAENSEQAEVAKLLTKSYILGQTMMRLNGVDAKRMARRAEPKFRNSDMQEDYEEMKSEYNKPEVLKKMVSNAYKNKNINAKKSIESTMPYQTREADQKKKERADRILANRELTEKVYDNILSYSGKVGWRAEDVDTPYEEKVVKKKIEELKKIDIHEFKCESVSDLINHYSENIKMCEQAEMLHYEIARGVEHGIRLPDEEAIEIRTKLTFFHYIRATMTIANKKLASNPDLAGATREEWNEELKGSISTKAGDIALYPGPVEELYKQCEEKIAAETVNIDEKLKQMWNIISPNDPPGDVPPEEVKKRKANFQSNAITSEFLHRQDYIVRHLGMSDAIIHAWSKKNGVEYKAPTRTQINFLEGKSAEEIIRTYKLMNGTSGEQYMAWREMHDFYHSYSLDEYNINSKGDVLDNFFKKSQAAIIGANFTDISQAMVKILKTKNNRGWLKLPKGYESIEEFEREVHLSYDVSCNYVAGRTSALTQIAPSEYRYFLSVEELGTISDEQLKLISKRLEKLENEADETEDDDKAVELKKLASSLDRLMYVNQEIECRKRKLQNVKKRASFNMSIVDLEKEERRYMENNLHAKEKEFLQDYKNEKDQIFHLRNNSIDDYYEKNMKKNKLYGAVNLRKNKALLSSMSYFQGTSEEQTIDTFKKINIVDKLATPEQRVEKRVEFEKIFNFILNFDLKLLSFKRMDDLLSKNNLDVRAMCNMMWDFDNDLYLTDYTNLRENYPDAGCTMDREKIRFIAQKGEFIKGFQNMYNTYPNLKINEELHPDEIMKLSPNEITEMMKKDSDPTHIQFYMDALNTSFNMKELGMTPPIDAEKLFNKELSEGKLMNKKPHVW